MDKRREMQGERKEKGGKEESGEKLKTRAGEEKDKRRKKKIRESNRD